jgi:hypothetical protein
MTIKKNRPVVMVDRKMHNFMALQCQWLYQVWVEEEMEEEKGESQNMNAYRL